MTHQPLATSVPVSKYGYSLTLSMAMAATLVQASANTLLELPHSSYLVACGRVQGLANLATSGSSISLSAFQTAEACRTIGIAVFEHDPRAIIEGLRMIGLDKDVFANERSWLRASQGTAETIETRASNAVVRKRHGGLFDIFTKHRGTFSAPEDWSENHDKY